MSYILCFLVGALSAWLVIRRKIGSLRLAARHIASAAHEEAENQKKVSEELKRKEINILKEIEYRDNELKLLNQEIKKLHKQKSKYSKEATLQARNEALAALDKGAFHLIQKRRQEIKENADSLSMQIVLRAMHRLDIPYISSHSKDNILLTTDQIGPLIGKGGCHIHLLEQLLEVKLVIDRGELSIATHCDLRRAVAKRTLRNLLEEKIITSEKIEKMAQLAKQEIEEECLTAGRDAFLSLSLPLPKEPLISLLGKLKLRYSGGQSVLDHSLNVSKIMGVMADEMGLRGPLAKRIGLMHDIGKAVSHEKGGSHALIGQELARRFGEGEEVANGIGSHHEEIEPITLEGLLSFTANQLDKRVFDKR